MRRLNAFCLMFVALFMATACFAQKYESVDNDPMGVRIYTLSNGLKVYMSVNKDEPRIQTYIAVRVGSKNDPRETTGLAHYFEHMMFKGTEKFGTTSWEQEKPYMDKIEDLYEVYRKETDKDKRAMLYKQIDSLSYIASGFAIPNEYATMMSFIGSKGTNAATSNDYTFYQENIPSNQLENWAKIQADRFANPVLRLFHTELETIYEEKNMSLTNEGRKVREQMLKALFPSHPYGQQTTLGEAEHLRNPSLKNIKAFHAKYYVPNNYCIAMSGDFNPDEAIKIIEKYFGSLPSKEVEPLTFQREPELTSVKDIEVKGIEAPYITIAYRMYAGNGSKDILIAELMDWIFSNGSTGLIDKNLNYKNLVSSASSSLYTLNDYSVFYFRASPKAEQTMEQLQSLLSEQIELMKKGAWDESILDAAIANLRLRQIKSIESNSSRAMAMAMAYLSNRDWADVVNELEEMKTITKADIVDFANKIFKSNNYVVIRKTQGEPAKVEKVEKPPITPIQINQNATSPFFAQIKSAKTKAIEPVFVDYSKDLKIEQTDNGSEVLYVQNKDNSRYSLSFVYKVGTLENKYLQLLSLCSDYLYTPFVSKDQVKEKLFNLATNINVFSNAKETTIRIEGLSENLPEAMELLEDLLANPMISSSDMENMKAELLKKRQDDKAKQSACFAKLSEYALYGKKEAFATLLSDKEISKLTSDQLCNMIKDLKHYGEQVRYYGDMSVDALVAFVNKNHKMEARPTKVAKSKLKAKQTFGKDVVYFVNYPANQSYCRMFIVSNKYDDKQRAKISMYNQYFGGGMNALVFQEMREKRSLAYQAYSTYNIGYDKTDRNYNIAHIATQNDKVTDALDAFNLLLDSMPAIQSKFDLAKRSAVNSIATNRVIKQSVINSFLENRRYERPANSMQQYYKDLQAVSLEDIQQFSKEQFGKAHKAYVILGNKEQIDMKALEKFGKVKELSLEDIFGY